MGEITEVERTVEKRWEQDWTEQDRAVNKIDMGDVRTMLDDAMRCDVVQDVRWV